MHPLKLALSSPLLAALLLASVLATTGCTVQARKARLQARAETYLEAGEHDKARIEYLNLLRLDPRNPVAIRQLGVLWLEAGAPLRAIPYLHQSRELAPQDPVGRTRYAHALLALGQTAEARQEAVELLRDPHGPDDAILLLADATTTPEELADTTQQLERYAGRDTIPSLLARAAVAVRNQDLPAAGRAIQQALVLDPQSVTAHLAMARYLWTNQDLAGADAEFKTAVALAPAASGPPLRYAEFKARTDAPGEAITLLQAVARRTPDCLDAWLQLAHLAFAGKRYDESLATLENIFIRDPANFFARLLQQQILLAKNEVRPALDGFERLHNSYPDSPLVKFEWARALLQGNNPAQATVVLNQAVAANPDYLAAVLLLAEVNLRTGDAPSVVAAMEALLRRHPEVAPARTFLARAYAGSGRSEEAAAIFREQIRGTPGDPQPRLSLALLLRRQGRNAEARQVLEEADGLAAPGDLTVTAPLVELDLVERAFARAHQRVAEQLRRTPGSAGALLLAGRVYAVESRWPEAEAAVLQALAMDADLVGAPELLVAILLSADKLPAALAQLEAVLAKKPDDAPALLAVALICERTQDFPRARDTYERHLALRPDNVAALNNLACLYAGPFDQPEKALDLARRARGLQPQDASVADTLGWILYRRGDYGASLALLEESARGLPDQPEVQFHLGMASYMLDRTEPARAAFRRALASPADFPGKTAAAGRLDLLEKTTDEPSRQIPTAALETLLEQRPDDLVGWMRLGERRAAWGEFPGAAVAYERVLKLNPKLLPATIRLAELHAGPLQSPERAMEFARRARALAPTDARVAGVLGELAYRIGNHAWAYSLLRESVNRPDAGPTVRRDLAWAAYSLGKIAESRQVMQEFLDVAPDADASAGARTFLAMTALDDDPPALAAAGPAIAEVLRATPDHVPAMMARAALDARDSNGSAAAATYVDVLRRLPDFAPAQKHLAILYAEEPENRLKAYELATRARKVLPDDPELAETLAALSYQRKEYPRTLQLLQESARHRSPDARSLYYLGMARLQTRQPSTGGEALRGALAAGLPGPLAAEAERALADTIKN